MKDLEAALLVLTSVILLMLPGILFPPDAQAKADCKPHKLHAGKTPYPVELLYMVGEDREFCGMVIVDMQKRYSPRREKYVTSPRRYVVKPGQDLETKHFSVYWGENIVAWQWSRPLRSVILYTR